MLGPAHGKNMGKSTTTDETKLTFINFLRSYSFCLKLKNIVVNDVTEWLASIGLEQHADAFTENDINFDLLTSLDHEVLQAIVGWASHHNTKSCRCIGRRLCRIG